MFIEKNKKYDHKILKHGMLLKCSDFMHKYNKRYFALNNRYELLYFHEEKEYLSFLDTKFYHRHTLKQYIQNNAKGYTRIASSRIKIVSYEDSQEKK